MADPVPLHQAVETLRYGQTCCLEGGQSDKPVAQLGASTPAAGSQAGHGAVQNQPA